MTEGEWRAAYLGSGDWAILDEQANELHREADVRRFIAAEAAYDRLRDLARQVAEHFEGTDSPLGKLAAGAYEASRSTP